MMNVYFNNMSRPKREYSYSRGTIFLPKLVTSERIFVPRICCVKRPKKHVKVQKYIKGSMNLCPFPMLLWLLTNQNWLILINSDWSIFMTALGKGKSSSSLWTYLVDMGYILLSIYGYFEALNSQILALCSELLLYKFLAPNLAKGTIFITTSWGGIRTREEYWGLLGQF